MTLQLIPSEFRYILGKFDFFFISVETPRLTAAGSRQLPDSPMRESTTLHITNTVFNFNGQLPDTRYGQSETLQLIDYEYLREFEVELGKA